MILVQIVGGLGNQMFQYAAARRMASKGDGVVVADLFELGIQVQPVRKYRLNSFNVQAACAPWHHVLRLNPGEFACRMARRFLPPKVSKRLLHRAERLGWKSSCHYRVFNYKPDQPKPALKIGRTVSERHFHFDPEVLGLSGDLLMMGFWQSEKYFADIAPQIRAEFQLRAPQEGMDLALAGQMQKTASVSLHVRRGDKATAKDFNASDATYCLRAVEWFRSRLANPVFFLFTDDWEWVRQHLPEAPDMVYVSHNSIGEDLEDWKWEENLRLMSQCKHHIIAPSSFSWWAAWLNPSPDKIVLSPPHRRWLNMPNCDTSDVIPDSWIQIDDR